MLNYYFLKQSSRSINRNISIFTSVYQKCDFIQQLFLDNVKAYKEKSGSNILYEPFPEITEEYKFAIKNLNQGFGVKEGEDMTKFPEMKFVDPVIDPINMEEHSEKTEDKQGTQVLLHNK